MPKLIFLSVKLKDKYCAAVRTAHKHGIKEISKATPHKSDIVIEEE